MSDYIIGSGAWYTKDGSMEKQDGDIGGMKGYGTSPETHKPEFFKLWLKAIEKFTYPDEIFIEDAHSDFIPDLAIDNKLRITYSRRTENLGHNKGWTTGILNGASYAKRNGANYFVYIEQDVLLWGDGIIENCLDEMTGPLMVGCACKCPWNMQQSFVIVNLTDDQFWYKFITALHPMDYIDDGIMPEKRWHNEFKDDMEFLSFCGGRERPIDWDAPFGYVQQIKPEELEILKGKI